MKVKVGDNVKIIAGKDKGKEGKIIRTLKKKGLIESPKARAEKKASK